MNGEEIDWSGVTEKMARQIFQQAETFMEAQLKAALAADARATAMAGLYTSLALAVLAGSFAYWQKIGALDPLFAGLAAGLCLIGAAIFAAWAARPTDFYFAGNQPHQWFSGRRNSLVTMIGGEAENYDERINYNDSQLAQHHKAINRAFVLAVVSPLAGIIGWFLPSITSLFSQA